MTAGPGGYDEPAEEDGPRTASQGADNKAQRAKRGEREHKEATTGIGPRESRAAAKSFEDLVVWQNTHRFVMQVYHLTQEFSRHEMFGVTSQLRRAAVSIPASIAEGFGKREGGQSPVPEHRAGLGGGVPLLLGTVPRPPVR